MGAWNTGWECECEWKQFECYCNSEHCTRLCGNDNCSLCFLFFYSVDRKRKRVPIACILCCSCNNNVLQQNRLCLEAHNRCWADWERRWFSLESLKMFASLTRGKHNDDYWWAAHQYINLLNSFPAHIEFALFSFILQEKDRNIHQNNGKNIFSGRTYVYLKVFFFFAIFFFFSFC